MDEHFSNAILNACSNRWEKCRLRHANFINIYLQTDMNAEATEHYYLLYCNLGKGRGKNFH